MTDENEKTRKALIDDAHTSPAAVDDTTWHNIGGLSVWDFFAASALRAAYDFQTAHGPNGVQHIAKDAADLADAMVAERGRRIAEI